MATLTHDQIDQLNAEGYLLVKGALDRELDIEPVVTEFGAILDRVASDLKRDGKIDETFDDLPFEERFIAVAGASPDPMIPNFEIALPNGGFTAVDQRNGKTLWQFPTNVRMKASPMTFTVGGAQYVAVAAGPNILCFGLTPSKQVP